MKLIWFIPLLPFLLLSLLQCQQPLDEELVKETVEQVIAEQPGKEQEEPEEPTAEPANIPPVVSINEGDCIVSNGADTTFTPLIIDPDDDEHVITWYVDDAEISTDKNCCISFQPETEATYTVSVIVSDGKAEDTDSVIVTVPAPPWMPEARHIYLYPENAEPDGTNYAKLYIADESTDYHWLYNAAKLVMESHNQDYPEDKWRIIGGGP